MGGLSLGKLLLGIEPGSYNTAAYLESGQAPL
jgi:hypothetical protein